MDLASPKKTAYRSLFIHHGVFAGYGVPRDRAGLGALGKSPWRMANSPVIKEALSTDYLRNSGLKSIKTRYQELRFT
jgi:hypothetical protein